MKRRMGWRRGWRALLACAGLLLAWQAAALWLKMEELPSAWETLRAVPAILSNGEDLLSILASLRRMALGFGLGLLIAVPLGLAMGRSKPLARLLNPLTSLAYPIPKAALMPIIMLWFGIGDLSKVLVIFMGVSLPLLYHSSQGAEQVDDKLVWSAQAMGMGRLARLARVILPAALPEVMLGCRVAVSMALITMISSEMIARRNGAGDLLFNAMDMAVYTDVYAVMLIIAAIGVALDVLVERLRAALTHWADTLQPGSAG
ncbi:MAG TPA: ABC transporter permease [Bordetella sp.]